MSLISVIIFGYLLGSVPFGLVLTRLAGYGDIRNIGSGNIGATNVLRTGNRFLAFATLVLDAGKGAIAVVAVALVFDGNLALLAGVSAMVGHCFPVWLGFKGGKGVATTLGILLVSLPLVGGLACATWVLVALVSRMSSVSSIVALSLSSVYAFFFYDMVWFEDSPEVWNAVLSCVIIASVVVYRHKSNISRLCAGTEPHIGKSKDI